MHTGGQDGQVQSLPQAAFARTHLAEQAHREGAALVLGGPSRREPSPRRADGGRREARVLRSSLEDRIQGNRDRIPFGEPDRVRLRERAHRKGPDPPRRRHPSPVPVPRASRRADFRESQGRAEGHFPHLQLDFAGSAQGDIRPLQGRDKGDRRRGYEARQGRVGFRARHGYHPRVLSRKLLQHRGRIRARSLRGGNGRMGTHADESP